MTPKLSVVISTYNRADMLADTLGDLARQTDAPPFEVVLVDDGSTDDTPGVARAGAERVALRHLTQDNQGLAAARNAGVAAAAAPIVAFLDDDVVVPPGWVAAVVHAFDGEQVVAIGGRIVVQFEAPPPAWLAPGLHSLLGRFDLGDHPKPIHPPEFPRGGNFAVRTAVWHSLGGLDRSLGWGSPANLPNEEKELFLRLAQRGSEVWYRPDAEVRHRIQPDRLDKEWFRSRMRAQGASDVYVDPPASRWAVGRELVRAGRAVPILGRGLLAGRGGFSARAWLDLCAGRLAALRRLRREGGLRPGSGPAPGS